MMISTLNLNPENLKKNEIKFLIGVDGGGSGTRVTITNQELKIISSAHGPPSALNQGIEHAWQAILETLNTAFLQTNIPLPPFNECAIGLGLSGANNLLWQKEFLQKNPGFKMIALDTDGYTTLLGAHLGAAGIIVAIGTGSVGMVLTKNNQRKDVSGWGFPAGDEASGAWLGLKAVRLTQKAIDGRLNHSPLTLAVKKFCGETSDEFLKWLGNAKPNNFAMLAPLIFENAHVDSSAQWLLNTAGLEIEEMVKALDHHTNLPLSICGRLGEALIPFVPDNIKKKNQKAKGDSTIGALYLIHSLVSK